MLVEQLDGAWWVTKDGLPFTGPFDNNAAAWRWLDRHDGSPISRSENVSEWIWQKNSKISEMDRRMKPTVCKHGNPMGVEIEPSEFYEDGIGRGGQIITRVTMPVCDACLLEVIESFANGQSPKEKAAGT